MILKTLKYSLILLLTFYGLTVQAQTEQSITTRIIGGNDVTDVNQYPWMTILLYADEADPSSAHFCGGSLIRPDLIITAAHCVVDTISPSDINVAIGILEKSKIQAQDRQNIASIYIHPQYNSQTLDNDIAILRLENPTSILPLNILSPTLMQQIVTDSPLLTSIGWGYLQAPSTNFTPSTSDLLQEVDLPYVSIQTCNAAPNTAITNNQMCAGPKAGGKDTCSGDSGGPLLYSNQGQWYIAGIVSHGNGCAQPNQYGVYTKVANYNNWINQTLDNLHIHGRLEFDPVDINQFSRIKAKVENLSQQSITVTNIDIICNRQLTIYSENCLNRVLIPNTPNNFCEIEYQYQPTDQKITNTTSTIIDDKGYSQSVMISAGDDLSPLNANTILDTTDGNWYANGAVWQADRNIRFQGSDSLVSGADIAILRTFVDSPNTINFSWRLNGSSAFDPNEFLFFIDNQEFAFISGNRNWINESVVIPEGRHYLTWIFINNNPFNDQSKAWIDNVAFANTIITPEPSTIVSQFGGQCTVPVSRTGSSSSGGTTDWLFLLMLSSLILYRKRVGFA